MGNRQSSVTTFSSILQSANNSNSDAVTPIVIQQDHAETQVENMIRLFNSGTVSNRNKSFKIAKTLALRGGHPIASYYAALFVKEGMHAEIGKDDVDNLERFLAQATTKDFFDGAMAFQSFYCTKFGRAAYKYPRFQSVDYVCTIDHGSKAQAKTVFRDVFAHLHEHISSVQEMTHTMFSEDYIMLLFLAREFMPGSRFCLRTGFAGDLEYSQSLYRIAALEGSLTAIDALRRINSPTGHGMDNDTMLVTRLARELMALRIDIEQHTLEKHSATAATASSSASPHLLLPVSNNYRIRPEDFKARDYSYNSENGENGENSVSNSANVENSVSEEDVDSCKVVADSISSDKVSFINMSERPLSYYVSRLHPRPDAANPMDIIPNAVIGWM